MTEETYEERRAYEKEFEDKQNRELWFFVYIIIAIIILICINGGDTGGTGWPDF